MSEVFKEKKFRGERFEEILERGYVEEDHWYDEEIDGAIVGVTSDDRIVYDDSKLPTGYEFPEEADAVVAEFLSEGEALKQGEGLTIFVDPEFEGAIVGFANGRLLYDYDKMVDALCEEDKMEPDEAVDFICYNTLRAMPYCSTSPIVLMKGFTFNEEDESEDSDSE